MNPEIIVWLYKAPRRILFGKRFFTKIVRLELSMQSPFSDKVAQIIGRWQIRTRWTLVSEMFDSNPIILDYTTTKAQLASPSLGKELRWTLWRLTDPSPVIRRRICLVKRFLIPMENLIHELTPEQVRRQFSMSRKMTRATVS